MENETISTEQTQSHASEAEADHIESAFQDDTQGAESEQVEQTEQVASEKNQQAQDKWPKKAENALARQKRENAKLKQERHQTMQMLQQMQAEIQALKGGQNKKGDAAPREEDFESYSDYIEARALYKAEQKFNEKLQEQTKGQQEVFKRQQAEMQRVERMNQVSVEAQKLAKQIPDLAEVIQNSGVDDLPMPVQNLILSARNPSLAAYNLAKEGILEQLAYMPVHMAAAEIVRAQGIMPKTQTQPNTTTQFKPMRGVSGSNGGKSGINADSSWSEMAKWLES